MSWCSPKNSKMRNYSFQHLRICIENREIHWRNEVFRRVSLRFWVKSKLFERKCYEIQRHSSRKMIASNECPFRLKYIHQKSWVIPRLDFSFSAMCLWLCLGVARADHSDQRTLRQRFVEGFNNSTLVRRVFNARSKENVRKRLLTNEGSFGNCENR